ncbi:MAG: type II toxin-antitoxin system RelE/ParE family toxin [Chloroflexota bacterium]
MRYLQYTAEAKADLARLDKPLAQQVFRKLRWLAANFDAIVPEPLTGDWKGIFKLRVGDYRALYTFDRLSRSQI